MRPWRLLVAANLVHPGLPLASAAGRRCAARRLLRRCGFRVGLILPPRAERAPPARRQDLSRRPVRSRRRASRPATAQRVRHNSRPTVGQQWGLDDPAPSALPF
jgi:hypothetical protein